MASTSPAETEPKKLESIRLRKTTPRSRAKKSAISMLMLDKKASTPRRRASPRSLRKAQDAEPEMMHKDHQSDEDKETAERSPVLLPVKEEREQEQQHTTQDALLKTEPGEVQHEPKEKAELSPAQDTQLRRSYLQRLYRQLQSTHPHHNDGLIRQTATNMEMEACQKAMTQVQYVAAMEQEINNLMQFEMEQANTSVYRNEAQGLATQSSSQMQSTVSEEMPGGYLYHQSSEAQSYEYAQALAKAHVQEQMNSLSSSMSFSTPRQSLSGDFSFQSLMGSQTTGFTSTAMHERSNNRITSMQNVQQGGNVGNQGYSMSMPPPTSQSFQIKSNVKNQGATRSMLEIQQQVSNYPTQQHTQHGSMRTPRVANLQEFSAQIQHLEKAVLIELLWNQRAALARWQKQAKQLELQLSAAQQSAVPNIVSPAFSSAYSSPLVSGGTYVSPNALTEAEIQRARDRSSSRMAQLHQMGSYGQQSNYATDNYAQANSCWSENPRLYWERIRVLKAAYEKQLQTAQRALAHNTAPPNSVYSLKAQSMIQNISLVLNILNEQPTNTQPRKFEVLSSIERFMQMSVIPIVQKVVATGALSQESQAAATSGSSSGVATTAVTYSSGLPSARDGTSQHVTDSGAQWSYSSTTGRHSECASLTEVGPKFSDNDSEGGASSVNSPTQIMDEFANSPTGVQSESLDYDPVRDETSTHRTNRVMESPAMTPKGLCTVPPVETRPSSRTEPRLPDFSPRTNPCDSGSSKVMDGSVEDSLNDFAEFDELDFGDQTGSGNFANENTPLNVTKKRGVEDV